MTPFFNMLNFYFKQAYHKSLRQLVVYGQKSFQYKIYNGQCVHLDSDQHTQNINFILIVCFFSKPVEVSFYYYRDPIMKCTIVMGHD